MFVSISLVNPGFPEGCCNLAISNHTGLTLTIHIVSPDANFCCCYYQKWNQVKLLDFSWWWKWFGGGRDGFFSFLLLLVGILLLQWSDSNGFVLKGMWKEVRIWIFLYTPKRKWRIEGSGREEGSVLIWYNSLTVRHMVFRGTPTDLHPKPWFCVVKALRR